MFSFPRSEMVFDVPEEHAPDQDTPLSLFLPQTNRAVSASWPPPTDRITREVEGLWSMTLSAGVEGMGFTWLDVATHGRDGASPPGPAGEAPNFADSFGIGFDASNPPSDDPFNQWGNIYSRPEHEISLHWDGMELVKRTTVTDFRDGTKHLGRFLIEYVVGGAAVSVWVDEEAVFDRFFVPGMQPYIGRPCFVGHRGDQEGAITLDPLRMECRAFIPAPEPPITVKAIDRHLNDHQHPETKVDAQFPEDTAPFGRIILTLRLDKPETRFDPWDRTGQIYVYDEEGERYELLRYITPYGRGHVWRVDVTDFSPLLCGTRTLEQACNTQGEGWVVTVQFDFYPGPVERQAYKVVNLWSGSPVIGNPEKPVRDFYVTRQVPIDPSCSGARVRMVVTGHGMAPNSNSAGEFMPIDRTLTMNGKSYSNRLWKDDNYLNPCRPQGGTWKYSRAGWAPGDVVRPWTVDLSGPWTNRTLTVGYELAPYTNENRGQTWEPIHRTEAQVILYR